MRKLAFCYGLIPSVAIPMTARNAISNGPFLLSLIFTRPLRLP